ncbi:MAG: ribonuclease [Clostridiaceae bacterium]|jgi:ribonuclease HII|nr:ribonuclease [Clostridiaceae bacterium]
MNDDCIIKFKETKSLNCFSTKEIKEKVDEYLYNNDLKENEKNIQMLISDLLNDSRKSINLLGRKAQNYIESRKVEIKRVQEMYNFDRQFGEDIYIAGVDEVGRGPLAGPICAASVILKLNFHDDRDLILGIKDSKKLSHKQREELSLIIKEKSLCYNIAIIQHDMIDSKGISWCNNEVLKKAVINSEMLPQLALSDGFAIRNLSIDNKFFIKGDSKSASIACASIIAKVYRDKIMAEYSKIYPEYGFDRNSGYGTKEHMDAIKKYGPCEIHRRSFITRIL